MFGPLFKEANDLQKDVIQIIVGKKLKKVNFITLLILGDNLGLYANLEFIESFRPT